MKGVGHFRSFLILCLFVPLFIPSISGQAFRLSPPAPIEAYSFKIIGGVSGTFGHRDGMGTNALFGSTTGLVVDRAGNLFIADAQLGGQTIRKMTPDGVVTTIAGKSGDAAELDGIGTDARFHSPHSITADKDGNFYVADFSGSTIRKIDSEGVVTTLAGSPLMQGSEDGTASEARFRGPRGIAIDAAGDLYVADHVNFTIRKVTSFGVVTTLAGVPLQRGTSDGMGSAARFDYPTALTMGNDGNIYVADLLSGRIRKVTPSGLVTTFATGLGMPTGIATDRAGNIYVVDSVNNQVKKVTPRGVVSTLQYGVPLFKFGGYDHGAIAIDREDNIYVADAGDRTILKSGPPERFMRLSLTFDDPFRARTVITEASINFNDWVPVQTNYSAGAIVDTNSPAFSERFYRGRAQ